MNLCATCKQPTKNPRFCSVRCSAKKTNSESPKRKRTLKCLFCEKPILSGNRHCKDCKKALRGADLSIKQATYECEHRSSAFVLIRKRARDFLKSTGQTKCMNCGYDKHVEACHVQPISSFPEETLLSVINSAENLIALCPNCHWEFDKGLLQIQRT